jgi:hypothetical protein
MFRRVEGEFRGRSYTVRRSHPEMPAPRDAVPGRVFYAVEMDERLTMLVSGRSDDREEDVRARVERLLERMRAGDRPAG